MGAGLSVSVVVAEGKQFLMALLQRLEQPCQALVDRGSEPCAAPIPMPITSNDDEAIIVEGLLNGSGQCRTSFWSHRNLTFLADDGIVVVFSELHSSRPEGREMSHASDRTKGGAE
jgi:hypothetical protein